MSTWTTCIKIRKTDGSSIGLTDLDTDINIDGLNYITASGYNASTYSTNSSLSVNYADVEGLLGVAGITREQIRAGVFDFAEIELFIYDYEDKVLVKKLATGNWGESKLVDNRYMAEFRSLTQRMQQSVGKLYTPHCTADFGDSKCKVNKNSLTEIGSITLVNSRLNIVDTTRTEVDSYWKNGVITFTSGDNVGRKFEIVDSKADGTITLFLPLSFPAQIGDAYSIAPGCDKTFDTCRNTYSNGLNFRGFPHIPGTLEILRIGKEGYTSS